MIGFPVGWRIQGFIRIAEQRDAIIAHKEDRKSLNSLKGGIATKTPQDKARPGMHKVQRRESDN